MPGASRQGISTAFATRPREDPAISRIPLRSNPPRLFDDDDFPGPDRVIRPDPGVDRFIENDCELAAYDVCDVRVVLRDFSDNVLNIFSAYL